MDYFDLDGIKKYKIAIDNKLVYQANSFEQLFFLETREKLKYLVSLLSKRLNQTLKVTYSEIPNKRGGRAMPIYYRDYIIIGFEKEGMNLNKNVFIKCCFYFWESTPMFYTQIDVNFKDENNPYNQDKEELNDINPYYVEVDGIFPKNWENLLDLLSPKVSELINGLEVFLINKENNTSKNNNVKSMDNKHYLNQILYGSPGTGKTYNTKELAVNIILGEKDRNREEILKLYNELQEKRQIYFTTFHQSMSYEDFIEGIKPDNSDGEITYEVKDGIFKQICNEAKYQPGITFEEAYKKILVDINNNDGYIQLKTKTNKVFHVGINKNGNLKLYTNEKLDKPQGVLTKDNLVKQINGEHVFEGWESYFNGVLDELKKNGFSSTTIDEAKKYVLIIDEINRGNISSIFGELITLIEEDKRKGNKEEIEVVLPYSNDKFSVPNNIYIIGTMNTADRSVEALDTALRRRFSFAEMKSKPELLQSHFILYNQLWKYNSSDWHDENWVSAEKNYKELFGLSNEWDIDDGKFWNTFTREGYNLSKHSELLRPYILNYFDLAKMLETINKRIELLIDKDHQIGHSYFINVESVNDLKEIFMNKVIPLLEEYFFGDFGKIGLVLGNEFIQKIDDKYKIQFANFDHEDNQTLREKPIYNFTNFEDWTLESFKSIYS